MARDEFPPAWFRERCSVLRQRGTAACQRVWGAAAPVGHRGLRTIKDASKKTFDRLRVTPRRTITRRYKVPLLVLGGVLLAAVFMVIIVEVPQRQVASWRGQPGVELKDLPKLENDARTTLIQGLGGLILLSGLGFTLWNLRLTQDKQITEHYTRAVEQLGSNRLAVRLGAIYALERIAGDSERYHWPIMEILTAYVREHAPWRKEEQRSQPMLAHDIQAILTVLGRRTRTYDKGEDHRLDLARTDLSGARLARTHLEGADLTETHLERVSLAGAHLEWAFLWHTHLEEAILPAARLNGAILNGAHLEGADLGGVNLKGVQGLTVEQLASVKTLYGARLDPPLREKIQQQHPHLLEESTTHKT